MVMNPRTHPRGQRPDFALPKPNPNPARMTNALWWLVCMREALEPTVSENGGTYANKPGYHNAGENVEDHGLGNSQTDHSIRRAPDRQGPWWKEKSSAHDWTFLDAQSGNYGTISKYTSRLVNSMKSLTDTRPDDVYAYTIGQIDGDRTVEGWNEYKDEPETGDESHLWHRHDSFKRNIIGDFWAMWKALTIDMGWTYDEWHRSTLSEETVATQFNADDKAELVAAVDQACATSAWPSGGGLQSKVGNGVLNAGFPLTPGANRTANWANLQAIYGKANLANDNAAAAAASIANLASLLAFLGMDISDPSWDPDEDPIVARVRYAIANPTP